MILAAEVLTVEKLYNMVPPEVHKTEWLEWDSYRVAAHQDFLGRWQPPVLIVGRRIYNYLEWLKHWKRSIPGRHDIGHDKRSVRP